MLFRKLLKISPFVILTILNLHSLTAQAGGVSGGGGDASERRVNEIRADILNWIDQGGAQNLSLPGGVTLETYQTEMSALLAPHSVVVGFVTTAQETAADNPELKVSVDGQPKTCRGFVSVADAQPHILCNTERFAATGEAEQYRLVHHEYAGLAGVEQNLGASSDYEISSQLTQYLIPETVLRLAVNRRSSTNVDTSTIFGVYQLLSKVSGNEDCMAQLRLERSIYHPQRMTIWDTVYIEGSPFTSFRDWSLIPNQGVWSVGSEGGSVGPITQAVNQSTLDSTITFNISINNNVNSAPSAFRRAFRRNELIDQITINLVLNRATGVLTYIRNIQPAEDTPIEHANTQVCLMRKVN